MASIIKIKRSSVSGNPSTLASGELAYSALQDNGSNGGDRLYIGIGDETNGNAVNHLVIGGKFFTDRLDHSAGTLTASSAIVVDGDSKIDNLKVDNIELNANTISTTNTNGNLTLAPNGTGVVDIPGDLNVGGTINATITGASDSAAKWTTPRDLSLTGDATATFVSVDGTADVSAALTLATVNNNVGSFGSTTKIPTFTINAKGLVTAAGEADVATTLSLGSDSGTVSVNLLNQTLSILGASAQGISTSAAGSTVTITATDASTTQKGVASFDNDNFTVTSGAVSTKNITLGSSSLTNGSTTNTLAGLQQLDVDNIRIDGNEISSTDTDGNISLNPNGTGVVSVNTSRITDIVDPVDPQDAATKAYVDARSAGLDTKESVKAATTGPITLSNTQTIDDVALAVGDRVLVKDQGDNTQNGIYIVADGAWSRSLDMDEPAELTAGLFFFVESGTLNGDAGFVKTSDSVGVVGTDPITFVQFSGAGQIIAGDALSKTGNQLEVVVAANGGIEISSNALQLKSGIAGDGLTYNNGVLDVVGTANRITANADSIDIASTYEGQTSITTLGTIVTGVWQGSVIDDAYIAQDLTINGGTINNTPVGASTKSTGAFTSLTANNSVTFTLTTNATSTSAAAVVLSGGLAVAKKIYVGEDLVGSGASTSNLSGFTIDGGTF